MQKCSQITQAPEKMYKVYKKKMGSWGVATDPQQRQSHPCDFRRLFGVYYFGFPLDFKFSATDGSAYLQALNSVLSSFTPCIFFKQPVGISLILMMLEVLTGPHPISL